MKRLFSAFYNSIYNLPWLKVQRFFLSEAWKYFSFFVLLFSVLYFIPGAIQALRGMDEAKNVISNLPDFEAEIKDGKLLVNKLKQPFHYKLDNDFSLIIDTHGLNPDPVKNFVTSTSISYLFISRERVELFEADSGGKNMAAWSQFPDFFFTKDSLQNGFEKWTKFPYSLFIGLLLFGLTYLAIFIGKIYSVFIISLVVSVFSKFSSSIWKWKELFAVTLFAVTLPSIIELGLILTGIQFQYIHFIALLSFMLAVVFTKNGETKAEDENGRVV